MQTKTAKEFDFWDDLVRFCQKLIQTPSISGEESEVARLVQHEMERLSYDEISVDRVGNVIGLIEGDKNKPSICFTAHMDTVPSHDESKWEYPPYSGVIADGYIHGRGAGDVKGPLATQVYVPRVLRKSGVKHGDIYVIEVVHEETGGLGTKYLDEDVKKKIDYVINGEPTSNMIHIGQRGRTEMAVTFQGKSAHASRPWQGKNPFYDVAEFILRLKNLEMSSYGDVKSTVVPTMCKTDTETSNVIPGECMLILDWRDVPSESEFQIMNKVKSILQKGGDVYIREYKLKTYTHLTFPMKRRKLPFSMDESHPLVRAVTDAVRSTLKKEVEIRWWEGATDCGYFAEEQIPIIGFSPSESKYSHTSRERISLQMMREAMECYPAIISNISNLKKRRQ